MDLQEYFKNKPEPTPHVLNVEWPSLRNFAVLKFMFKKIKPGYDSYWIQLEMPDEAVVELSKLADTYDGTLTITFLLNEVDKIVHIDVTIRCGRGDSQTRRIWSVDG